MTCTSRADDARIEDHWKKDIKTVHVHCQDRRGIAADARKTHRVLACRGRGFPLGLLDTFDPRPGHYHQRSVVNSVRAHIKVMPLITFLLEDTDAILHRRICDPDSSTAPSREPSSPGGAMTTTTGSCEYEQSQVS